MDDHPSLENSRRLIEISRDLASTLDLDSLLRRIIQAAVEIGGAEAASLLLYNEKKQELYFQSATNAADEPLMQGIVVPRQSVAGWVAINRQSAVVDDVHRDRRFFGKVEKALDFPTRSLLAVPLIARDKLIGVLELVNKLSGVFTDQDLDSMVVLGAQAAVAIQNARLFQQSDQISELVHELRTPLTSINTIAYLLERPEVTDEQRTSMARTICEETRRLNELTTNFLDLSRLESGRIKFQFTDVNLPDLMEEVCAIFEPQAAARSVSLRLDFQTALPQLKADRDKLKQVVINLLSNAVKYNRPNGQVFIYAWQSQGALFFSVRDTGIGMDEETRSHLFENFFRGKNVENESVGTGLGLSICKKIIEGHRGQLTVESQPGIGTKFTVQLPLHP